MDWNNNITKAGAQPLGTLSEVVLSDIGSLLITLVSSAAQQMKKYEKKIEYIQVQREGCRDNLVGRIAFQNIGSIVDDESAEYKNAYRRKHKGSCRTLE